MQKPDWVFYDFGETLIYEHGFDEPAGYAEVLSRAAANPRDVTLNDVLDISRSVYPLINKSRAGWNIESYSPSMHRLIFDTLGVKFDMSFEELDDIFWDAAAPGFSMPHAPEALDGLKRRGIRAGVVSNIGFSGASLKRRIDAVLPGNSLEFVIASSDYIVRKPLPEIFKLALGISGAQNAWFVGDNPVCDVLGAHRAGLRAIWYKSGMEGVYRNTSGEAEPDCPHDTINDHLQLLDMIDALTD